MNYELRVTQYNHPDITSGMHTNGRANVFVRKAGESGDSDTLQDWYLVNRHEVRNLVKVRLLIAELGIERFIEDYCTLAEK
jgi:hypothetical protein